MKKKRVKRIYLDFASTTPVDPEVATVISSAFKLVSGNPSSLHEEGRLAKEALEAARAGVAKSLGASLAEVVFTSGGTEANSLAINGVLLGLPDLPRKHIVTSTIEHSSVLEPIRKLEREGVEVTYLKPDSEGVIDPKSVRDALRPETVLVSIMYANNEIGTVQPIKEISKVIRTFKKSPSSKLQSLSFPYFHTDAAQALGYLDMNIERLGVDLLSIDSGKIYGPKGVGALYIRRGVTLAPETLGGGQERGMRPGTENVPLIMGFAKALEINEKIKIRESARLTKLRDYFIKKLLKIPGVSLNGHAINRLPNNVSICIEGLDAEFAVYELDHKGIAASSASTCMNLKEDSYSYVVEEIGKAECKSSSLRFSLGRTTSKSDLDVCIKALEEVLLLQSWNTSQDSKQSL